MSPQPAWGANPSDWYLLDLGIGVGADLLPVVSNPKAKISPKSKMKSLGKTPSLYNVQGEVIGIAEWTTKQPTQSELERWMAQPDYGICLQTRLVRGIDIDVPDNTLADEICVFISSYLGFDLPKRFRSNSGKCLLAFELKGNFSKRVFKVRDKVVSAHGENAEPAWMVEFLANGQQFVAFGTHPSGARYEWSRIEDGIPKVEPETFEALWSALIDRFALSGSSSFETGQRKRGEDLKIDDPLANALYERGLVLGEGSEGKLFIDCPWRDGHSSDTGVAQTCYFPAGTNGYQQGHFKCLHAGCQERSDTDFVEALDLVDIYLEMATSKVEVSPNGKRFELIPAAEFANLPTPSWLIKHVLPSKGLGMVFGASGSGKTFLTMDMMMAVGRALPNWFSHKCKFGRIAYVAAEGAIGIRKRLKAYKIYHEVLLDELPINFIDDRPDLSNKAQIEDLVRSIQENGPVNIVVIDTLAQTTPGADENTGKDMGKVFNYLHSMASQLDCLVLLVHHSGKDSSKGARGWSGMHAALDTQIEVSKEGNSRCYRVSKQKDGEEGDKAYFKLESVELGEDEDKEPITSCVVLKAEPPSEQVRVQGKWQELVIETSEELLEFDDSVPIEALIKACLDRGSALPGEDKDSMRDKIKRAIGRLLEKGGLLAEGLGVALPQNY